MVSSGHPLSWVSPSSVASSQVSQLNPFLFPTSSLLYLLSLTGWSHLAHDFQQHLYTVISQIDRSSLISHINSRVSYLCVYLMFAWMFNKHLKLDMSSACKLLQTCSSSSIPHFCKRPNILKLTLTYLHLTHPTFSLSANLVSYKFKFIQKRITSYHLYCCHPGSSPPHHWLSPGLFQ